MESPKPAVRRPLKPWLVFAVVGAAVVVFAGIWLAVGNRKLDREFAGPRHTRVHRSKEWKRANELCRRLNAAGTNYAVTGMLDSALACFHEVLRIAEEQGIPERMAACYQDMSNVFDYKGMPESVRFYMGAAIALNRASGKRYDIAGGLLEEGTFRFNTLGDLDSGKVLLEKALAESRSKGDSKGEAAAFNNLGKIQATLEHYDSARVLLESCAAKSHAVKDASGEASALHSLALLYLRRDRSEDASKWLLKTLEVAHAGDIIGEEAPALFELALIRADKEEYELAQVSVEQALKLYERAGDNGGMNACRAFTADLIDAQRWKHRSAAFDSLLEI
jgi:tetratricopeptide (TPR) repeat protein